METGQRQKFAAFLVGHEVEMHIACAECHTLLKSGWFGIGMLIGAHRYLVAENPPLVCCGKEKPAVLLFENQAAAEKATAQILETIAADDSIVNLRLIEVVGFPPHTVH